MKPHLKMKLTKPEEDHSKHKHIKKIVTENRLNRLEKRI